MHCSKCGVKNDNSARFCASCGRSMTSVGGSSSSGWIITGIFISLVVLVGVGYGLWTVMNPPAASTRPSIGEVPISTVVKELVHVESKPVPVKVEAQEKDKTIVIKETLPKVFTIFTSDGMGSGFLYKDGGLIVTNAHVVAGFTDVVVRNSSGQDSLGKVIGISDRFDVALIRAADYLNAEPLVMDSLESRIGTEIIALGSPQGFENSASIGYLTGLNRDMELDFVYEKVYQIDAQIDQGSSGGPLLDAKTGKVIGINSVMHKKNTPIGFSIPMYSVIDLLDSWAKKPMDTNEVAAVFGVYEDYTYSESASTATNADSNYDDYFEDEEVGFVFEEESLTTFLLTFREYYEMTLHYEEFYWIEDMLLPGSNAYHEFYDYVQEVSGQGMAFNFTTNTVTDIEIYSQYAAVHTIEEFEFVNAAGELSNYERSKEYRIQMDENGYYQITDVFIHDS